MIKVILDGKIGYEMGQKEWGLNAKTPQEAFHAINMNTEGKFVQYFYQNRGLYDIIFESDNTIIKSNDESNITLLEGPCKKNEVIKIVPVIEGKDPGTTTIIINILVSVLLAVASAYLFPAPEPNLSAPDANTRGDSYLFSGSPRTTQQGMAVPLGYGTMMAHGLPINVRYNYPFVTLVQIKFVAWRMEGEGFRDSASSGDLGPYSHIIRPSKFGISDTTWVSISEFEELKEIVEDNAEGLKKYGRRIDFHFGISPERKIGYNNSTTMRFYSLGFYTHPDNWTPKPIFGRETKGVDDYIMVSMKLKVGQPGVS